MTQPTTPAPETELLALPEQIGFTSNSWIAQPMGGHFSKGNQCGDIQLFTADQMREYALANLAARTPPASAPLSDGEMAELRQAVHDGDTIDRHLGALISKAIESRSTSPDVAELVAACENLLAVKGRYHTEQAFNRMVAALAKYKGEK